MLNKSTQAKVFVRDQWCCRYCGTEVLFSPSLRTLEQLVPGHGYYHRNGRRDQMAGLLLDQCACIDHIVPVSKGGTDDLDNLVCACWRCNTAKSDQDDSLWRMKIRDLPPIRTAKDWDGLLGILARFDPNNEWIAAFRRTEDTKKTNKSEMATPRNPSDQI